MLEDMVFINVTDKLNHLYQKLFNDFDGVKQQFFFSGKRPLVLRMSVIKLILTTVAYATQVPTRRPIAAPPFVKYKLNYIPTCQIIFMLVRFPTDTGLGNLAIFILFSFCLI